MENVPAISSLIVPLFVIISVMLTKRVVMSLFFGIVLAALMINNQDLTATLHYVFNSISGVFFEIEMNDGDFVGINVDSYGLYIFGFLLILGILTQVVLASGGIGAFVKWARQRIKTPQGSELVAFFAGVIIFIDDYFNALCVGQISRPINDAYHSSRERLAYIIDSTSAPICILIPISSWGAYNMGIIGELNIGNSLFVLLETTSNNFYAIFALVGVFLTIIWKINLPAMRNNVNVEVEIDEEYVHPKVSSSKLLFVPMAVLIFSITFLLFYTGYGEGSTTLIAMLENTDTAKSLFFGGILALVVSFIISRKHIDNSEYPHIFKAGIKSMTMAVLILIFAWAIGPIIKNDLQTGLYLANLAKEYLSQDHFMLIPIVLFFISAFIAFCTGTSWGTFAIMIPIGASLALEGGLDPVVAIASILSGAVYGDHTSPISDTTILSSAGANCSVQSHFITQLPYATTIMLCATISFLTLSLTQSTILSFIVGLGALFGVFYYYKVKYGDDLENGQIVD